MDRLIPGLIALAALGSTVVVAYSLRACPVAPTPQSLREAWEGRSLVLRPDGCVELQTARGQRTFVYQRGDWRECPSRSQR